MKKMVLRTVGVMVGAVLFASLLSSSVQAGRWSLFDGAPGPRPAIDVVEVCQNGITFGGAALEPPGSSIPYWIVNAVTGEALLADEGGGWPYVYADLPTSLTAGAPPEVYQYRSAGYEVAYFSKSVQPGGTIKLFVGGDVWFKQLGVNNCYVSYGATPTVSVWGIGSATDLVFEATAYRSWGDRNGDGIFTVRMAVINSQGREVQTRWVESPPYCFFGYDQDMFRCAAWDFAAHHYRWPNGQPIVSGNYKLQAIAYTTHDESNNWQPATASVYIKSIPWRFGYLPLILRR